MPKVINTKSIEEAMKIIEAIDDKENQRKLFSTRQIIDEGQLSIGLPIIICSIKDGKTEKIYGIVSEMPRNQKGRKFFWFKKAPSGKDKRIFLDEYSIVKYTDGTWNQQIHWIEIDSD